MRAFAALVLMLCVWLSACGSGNNSPTNPGGGSAGIPVLVVFTPVGGTYTATLNNQTYTAQGGFTINLSAGSHEITGTFRGQGFGIGFASVGGGGAESGSLRTLAGPSPDVRQCSALYFNDAPAVLREFRLQFRVTGNVGSACQAG